MIAKELSRQIRITSDYSGTKQYTDLLYLFYMADSAPLLACAFSLESLISSNYLRAKKRTIKRKLLEKVNSCYGFSVILECLCHVEVGVLACLPCLASLWLLQEYINSKRPEWLSYKCCCLNKIISLIILDQNS